MPHAIDETGFCHGSTPGAHAPCPKLFMTSVGTTLRHLLNYRAECCRVFSVAALLLDACTVIAPQLCRKLPQEVCRGDREHCV